MDPEEAARAAIEDGQLLEHRGNTEPDTSMAVAVDVQSDVAAAYVVTQVRGVEWQTDVITFARVGAAWEWRAEGGSGCGDLPLERSSEDGFEGLGPVDTSMTSDGDIQFVTVGGFSTASVAAIELSVRETTRRVPPNALTGAFVVAVTLPAEPEVDPDEIDVRAIDATGSVVDSTAAWRAERDVGMPDTITVAEAHRLPNGSSVTIRAQLLVLPDKPVRLCDRIDTASEPPEPSGPSLVVQGLSPADLPLSSTQPGSGVGVSIVVMSGTVESGVIRPGP